MSTSLSRQYLRSRSKRLMRHQGRLYTPGRSKVSYDPFDRSASVIEGQGEKYIGPIRYWEVSAGSKALIGEREYTVSQSWVSIPYDALTPEGGPVLPESDDHIQILSGDYPDIDDPALVGRYLRVLSVVRGGELRASRKMLCEFIDFEEADY